MTRRREQPYAAMPIPKAKKWTVMLGARKFAMFRGKVWWTKSQMEAIKLATTQGGPDAKVITEAEFNDALKGLLASQIHKRLPGMTMRCGTASEPGVLCTDTEGEVTCPKCKLDDLAP